MYAYAKNLKNGSDSFDQGLSTASQQPLFTPTHLLPIPPILLAQNLYLLKFKSNCSN